MYYNHNLRTNLQEWKNRVQRASTSNFGYQIDLLLKHIQEEPALNALMVEAAQQFPHEDEHLQERINLYDSSQHIPFSGQADRAAFSQALLHWIIREHGVESVPHMTLFIGRKDVLGGIVEDCVSPILDYLHDRLDKSSSTLYLLEKYKRRTEWFMKDSLRTRYLLAEKEYEKIFEDDLRLFLFDQGIDYPFSTPSSPSGRADVVGAIDTSDPLVVEIKIFDRSKSYGKDRVRSGLAQVMKYVNDYNKDFGYLVIFNADNAELHFQLEDISKAFPPMLVYNNKRYFFIVVNIGEHVAASKVGKQEVIELSTDFLVSKAELA